MMSTLRSRGGLCSTLSPNGSGTERTATWAEDGVNDKLLRSAEREPVPP